MTDTAESLATALADRHNLSDLEPIGEGGMGQVFKAWDSHLERHVAVKVLKNANGDSSYQQRFITEMRILAKIKHSAVVSLHHAGITPGDTPYFVMDYIKGTSLADALAHPLAHAHPEKLGAYTIKDTCALLGNIAQALDYLHFTHQPRIIHRDIKPANILLAAEPSEAPALLTDFSISHSQTQQRLTRVGTIIGTEAYMPPELYTAEGAAPTAQGDNYSLALVAYEMIAGRSLRDAHDSTQAWRFHRRYVPITAAQVRGDQVDIQALNAVFSRALALDPAVRFDRAAEFIAALSACATPPLSTRAYEPADYTPAGADPKNKDISSALVKLFAAALVIASLACSAVVLWRHYSAANSWGPQDAQLAAAFPTLVAAHPGEAAWRDFQCYSATPQAGERARIACGNDGTTIIVADYHTPEDRQSRISATQAERLQNNRCTVERFPAPGETSGTVVLPTSFATHIAVLVVGADAASISTQLPLC